MYDWEKAPDTSTTWRIGDGTAAFYNYVYHLVAGFSEHDTFRSNQIREGQITRVEALALIEPPEDPRTRLNEEVVLRAQTALERGDHIEGITRLQTALAELPGADWWVLERRASVRLLLTMDDLVPIVDPHPAGAHARHWFAAYPGRTPAGAISASWLPA